jgi:hypothetical protein
VCRGGRIPRTLCWSSGSAGCSGWSGVNLIKSASAVIYGQKSETGHTCIRSTIYVPLNLTLMKENINHSSGTKCVQKLLAQHGDQSNRSQPTTPAFARTLLD